jgi:hypothetical protein
VKAYVLLFSRDDHTGCNWQGSLSTETPEPSNFGKNRTGASHAVHQGGEVTEDQPSAGASGDVHQEGEDKSPRGGNQEGEDKSPHGGNQEGEEKTPDVPSHLVKLAISSHFAGMILEEVRKYGFDIPDLEELSSTFRVDVDSSHILSIWVVSDKFRDGKPISVETKPVVNGAISPEDIPLEFSFDHSLSESEMIKKIVGEIVRHIYYLQGWFEGSYGDEKLEELLPYAMKMLFEDSIFQSFHLKDGRSAHLTVDMAIKLMEIADKQNKQDASIRQKREEIRIIKEEIRVAEVKRNNLFSTKIQAFWRGYVARKRGGKYDGYKLMEEFLPFSWDMMFELKDTRHVHRALNLGTKLMVLANRKNKDSASIRQKGEVIRLMKEEFCALKVKRDNHFSTKIQAFWRGCLTRIRKRLLEESEQIAAVHPGHIEILFDKGTPKEAIEAGDSSFVDHAGVQYLSVMFHSDGELRHYHDPYRLARLRIECQKKKRELGIEGKKIRGRLRIGKCACGVEFPVSQKYRGRAPKCRKCLKKAGKPKPKKKESPLMAKVHKQVLRNAQDVDPGLADHLRNVWNPDRQPDRPMPECCEICGNNCRRLLWKTEPAARFYGAYYHWYCPKCYTREKHDEGVCSSDDDCDQATGQEKSATSVQEKVARVSTVNLILEGIRCRPSIVWDIEECDTYFYINLAGGYRLLVTILMDRLKARTVEITLSRNGKPIKNKFGFEDKNSNRIDIDPGFDWDAQEAYVIGTLAGVVRKVKNLRDEEMMRQYHQGKLDWKDREHQWFFEGPFQDQDLYDRCRPSRVATPATATAAATPATATAAATPATATAAATAPAPAEKLEEKDSDSDDEEEELVPKPVDMEIVKKRALQALKYSGEKGARASLLGDLKYPPGHFMNLVLLSATIDEEFINGFT